MRRLVLLLLVAAIVWAVWSLTREQRAPRRADAREGEVAQERPLPPSSPTPSLQGDPSPPERNARGVRVIVPGSDGTGTLCLQPRDATGQVRIPTHVFVTSDTGTVYRPTWRRTYPDCMDAELPPGRYIVRYGLVGFRPMGVTAEVVAGEKVWVHPKMYPGEGVYGVVRNEAGKPVADLEVRLQESVLARTDAEGRFFCHATLPALHVFDPARRYRRQEFMVRAGHEPVALVVAPATVVHGLFSDKATTLEIAFASTRWPQYAVGERHTVSVAEGGRFALADPPPGNWFVVVTAKPQVFVFGPVALGDKAVHLGVVRGGAPTLDVAVTDPQGKPIAQARLTLRHPGGRAATRTDSNGRAQFAAVPACEYCLDVVAQGYDPELFRRNADASRAPTLRLTPLSPISGRPVRKPMSLDDR